MQQSDSKRFLAEQLAQTTSESQLHNLRLACLYIFCTREISFSDFKIFAEYLGGYQNTLPAQRTLNQQLMQQLTMIFGWDHASRKAHFINCYENRYQLAVLHALIQGD